MHQTRFALQPAEVTLSELFLINYCYYQDGQYIFDATRQCLSSLIALAISPCLQYRSFLLLRFSILLLSFL